MDHLRAGQDGKTIATTTPCATSTGLEPMSGVERVEPATISPEPAVETCAEGLSPFANPHPRLIDREPPFGKSLDRELVRVMVAIEFPNANASASTAVPAEPEMTAFSNASKCGKFSINMV